MLKFIVHLFSVFYFSYFCLRRISQQEQPRMISRALTVESNYVCGRLLIGVEIARQFFNQWEAKPKNQLHLVRRAIGFSRSQPFESRSVIIMFYRRNRKFSCLCTNVMHVFCFVIWADLSAFLMCHISWLRYFLSLLFQLYVFFFFFSNSCVIFPSFVFNVAVVSAPPPCIVVIVIGHRIFYHCLNFVHRKPRKDCELVINHFPNNQLIQKRSGDEPMPILKYRCDVVS